MKVANNLRVLIQKKWKKLVEVSEWTWLSFQQISAIQNNKPKKISYTTIEKLITYFDCSFDDLFTVQENG